MLLFEKFYYNQFNLAHLYRAVVPKRFSIRSHQNKERNISLYQLFKALWQ